MREKVKARLIRYGFSAQSADELTSDGNFEYAIKQYSTPRMITDCILALI